MKKIIIGTTTLFTCITLLLIFYTYKEISKTEELLLANIEKSLNNSAQNLSSALVQFENDALNLAAISDFSTFQENMPKNTLSIFLLNSQMGISKGFEKDAGGHVHEVTNITLPKINRSFGWIDIELNSALRTSKAIYIIPTTNQQFLLITFNLSPLLNELRSLSFGFSSHAYIESIQAKEPSISLKLSALDRIFNSPIHLKAPVLRKWLLLFDGNWQDVYPYPTQLINLFFLIIIFSGISIISITSLLLKIENKKPKRLWTISLLIDLYCVIIIFFLFSDLPSTAKQTLARTNSYKKTQEFMQVDPSVLLIPTAVYIDSLFFPDDTSFLVTGFIAQIYPRDNPIETGFLFPTQSTLYPAIIQEISRWENEDTITILWHFGVGLTSPFSTKFFPFDKRIAEITLWPTELHKNIVFFPNFLNFSTLNVLEKPGFAGNLDPNGWVIEDSSFVLKDTSPYQFFFPAETDAPLTYEFAISLSREFLGAFLSDILVLVLCIFVSFLILFIPRDSLLDSLFATISIFVGLIFIAVTNHSSLRQTLEVSSFAYIEYLFISFYATLIAITMDFILRQNVEPSELDQNYKLAMAYWPVLLGSFTLMLIFSIYLNPI